MKLYNINGFKIETDGEDIEHHGVKGQKWGRRRYQNPDGTLTELGKRRYQKAEAREEIKAQKKLDKETARSNKAAAKLAKEEEATAKKKEYLLTKGSKEEVYKNRDLFTNEELQAYVERKRITDQLQNKPVKKSTSSPETKTKMQKATDAIKKTASNAEKKVDAFIQYQNERKKEKILKKGKIKDVYKNRKLFTDKEIQEVLNRHRAETQLKENATNKFSDVSLKKAVAIAATIGVAVKVGSDLFRSYQTGSELINNVAGKRVLPDMDLAKKERKAKEARDKARTKKISNMTPEQILKNKSNFTNSELADYVKRHNSLSSITKQAEKRAKDFASIRQRAKDAMQPKHMPVSTNINKNAGFERYKNPSYSFARNGAKKVNAIIKQDGKILNEGYTAWKNSSGQASYPKVGVINRKTPAKTYSENTKVDKVIGDVASFIGKSAYVVKSKTDEITSAGKNRNKKR